MPSLSLKTKMSLTVSILLVALICICSLFIFAFFEREFKETISGQQFTLISGMADRIDEKIDMARKTVIAVAGAITPEMVGNADLAQKFLDSQISASFVFDNGLFLFSGTGKMIAEAPFLPGRRGKDYSFRDYFRQTIERKAPCISLPYFSSQQHHHPSVNFTAPVFSADGKIIAVLAGSVDLMRDNFLGSLSRIKIARSGYLYLYSTDRTMIMHPEKSRILQKDVPVGANRLFDRAIDGFEGTGETVNSRGLRALATFKRLKTTNWILAANYPISEAYEPIVKIKRFWLPATGIIVVVSVLIIWFVMNYLTIPIYLLNNHMREMTREDGVRKPVKVGCNDEIAELADTFNLLMASLSDKENELRKLSRHDNLTGLANRNLLQDRLDHALAWADRYNRRVGILFIDLDQFKQTNDTLGHALGDQLLKEFAKRLLGCVRQSDTVARLGGDEFIIMLTEITAPENAAMVARKIVSSLVTPCHLDGHEVLISASIGIAIYPSDGENGEALIRNADSAMYQAKQQRGSHFEFHEREIRREEEYLI